MNSVYMVSGSSGSLASSHAPGHIVTDDEAFRGSRRFLIRNFVHMIRPNYHSGDTFRKLFPIYDVVEGSYSPLES